MRARDWLLMYLTLPTDESEAPPKADPIRIQKGLFLMAMEGGIPASERYHFVAYNYGACSFDIYGDLDALVREGKIERIQEVWEPWPRYLPTQRGLETARQIQDGADSNIVTYMRRMKSRLFRQGFTEMLREIYRKYPGYAANSLLKMT